TLSGPDAAKALDIKTTVQGPGARIATVGGLFNGDVLAPADPIDGSLAYAPVPSTATFGVTVGAAPQVRAGASTAVSATVAATIVYGTRTRKVGVGISALPASLSVTYAQGTDALSGLPTRTVSYAASSSIPKPTSGTSLSVHYTDSD